jgi:hypothetical protein
MTTHDIFSVLNFSAFRPESDDPSAIWRRRFPNRRSLFLSVGRNALTWRGIQRNGQPGEGDVLRGLPSELLGQVILQLKDATEDGQCAVSINTCYVISLETNLSRRPGSEEIIKTNPRSVLGARYEKGKRYAVTHSPETNSSILLACDEDNIRKLETQLRAAGLRVGRFCCGTYILLRHALGFTNTIKGSDKPLSCLYVICCQGSVCALVQDEDRWMELRSRTDVYEDTVDAALELLAPFNQKVTPGMEIVFVGDTVLPEMVEGLGRLFSGHKINDLSQPNLLNTLMVQN